jgi:hypothetical protein
MPATRDAVKGSRKFAVPASAGTGRLNAGLRTSLSRWKLATEFIQCHRGRGRDIVTVW